jgi:hypothetical protein
MLMHIVINNQCCGAGAARIRIILVEPEPSRDAAPVLTAPNMMFNMESFQKKAKTE